MKNIRKILTVLLVAMLFVSCNADMDGLGIFHSIKISHPDTSFKLRKLSGAIPSTERFLIETDDGIDVYDVSNTARTNLVTGLNAKLKFTTSIDDIHYVFYTTNAKNNVTYRAKVVGDYESITEQKEITLKLQSGVEIKELESSYFNEGNYVIIAEAADNSYYFINNPSNGTFAEDSYTFNEFYLVSDKEFAPVYIGGGFYYVEHHTENGKFWNVYRIDGTPVKLADDSNLNEIPFAVENNYLFAAAGSIYKINGSTLTKVSTKDLKHSFGNILPGHEAPMVTAGTTIYGFANSKPFKFDGSTITEGSHVGEISVIDMYYQNGKFYAFTSKNGILTSTDGINY